MEILVIECSGSNDRKINEILVEREHSVILKRRNLEKIFRLFTNRKNIITQKKLFTQVLSKSLREKLIGSFISLIWDQRLYEVERWEKISDDAILP